MANINPLGMFEERKRNERVFGAPKWLHSTVVVGFLCPSERPNYHSNDATALLGFVVKLLSSLCDSIKLAGQAERLGCFGEFNCKFNCNLISTPATAAMTATAATTTSRTRKPQKQEAN